MEVTFEKANGEPLSAKDMEILFNILKKKFASFAPDKDVKTGCKISHGPHEVEIFYDEDEAYVYAAALCPGITKERVEVFIDGGFLIIETKPFENKEKGKHAEKPRPWKCIEEICYVGECELPADVIAEEATAELTNGVLYILMPKTEVVKPKSVPVI